MVPCRSGASGTGRFLEVTHLDPLGGSRKDVTHWAVRKTVSQALLLSCPRSLPDKEAGVAGRGAQALMWAGASALGLAAFHKELSAPSQFLLEAQCPGAAAPDVGTAITAGVFSGWRELPF